MVDCASTCTKAPGSWSTALPDRVLQAAEALARQLACSPEFQVFMQTAYAVRHDPQVEILSNRIDGLELDYDPAWDGIEDQAEPGAAFEDLENQLENLAVVRGYRRAETKARAMFSRVDDCISETAGVGFAEHAKPAACG